MLKINKNSILEYSFSPKIALVEIKVFTALDQIDFENNPAALLEEFRYTFKHTTNKVVVEHVGITKVWGIYAAKPAKTNHSELESIRRFAVDLYSQVSSLSNEASIDIKHLSLEEQFVFLEAFALASYKFLAYKKPTKARALKLVNVTSNFTSAEQKLLNSLLTGVCASRDLVNEPPCSKDALKFSDLCTRLGEEYDFKVEVLHKKQLESLKMGGILGVNKGSSIPPTLTILEYNPEGAINKQPLVLVGKGVMFDTGGYSIKTGGYMSTMKSDMAGASVVLGTLIGLAKSKSPYHVVGIIPATDNKINSEAMVVDDILTMYNGMTVEVGNTDAEGRLILGDALSYASKYKPELVIDLATLTGAAAAITGPYGIAMVGNDEQAAKDILFASDQTHELVAQLPYWDEFDDLLKSEVADIKNIGGPIAGASTAGKFLEKFTDYPWLHLDIAGPSFLDKQITYKPAGGTGVGVRLLLQYIYNRIQDTTDKIDR